MLIDSMINSLEDVLSVLSDEGYKPAIIGDAVSFRLGSSEDAFLAIITILENELTVTCQIGTIQNSDDLEKLATLGIAALDLNFSIRPYAIATVRGADDSWPLVLTDSLSMTDLSPAELRISIEGLRGAIHSCADFIRKFSL